MDTPANKTNSNEKCSKTTKDTKPSKITNKEIRDEYFKQLRSWMATVQSYQCYYNHIQQEILKNNYQPISKKPNVEPRDVPDPVPETQTTGNDQFVGIKCKIPSLWKRFQAEFIDFIILIVLKFVVAYFLLDSIIDFDFTKFNTIFMQDDFTVDYPTAVEMTSELFFLEVAHKFVVCAYEVYWLQGGTLFQGGATVGKLLLGLTVVRAEKLFLIRGQPNDVIALTPGNGLGWKRAALRSVTKNWFFAFMFPLPFISVAANQNRCAYDVLCGSMVVEVTQPLRCEQSELIPIA